MLFSLRISLPDRPGTLGSVATAFGRGGANILTLDVLGSESGLAVDDLVVEAPEGLTQALLLAQEAVPGIVVEELRPLEVFQDVMSPLELAAELAEQDQQALSILVERLPEALRADWCAVIRGTEDGLDVVGRSLGCPQLGGVRAPWMPLSKARRLPAGDWMPPSWTIGPGSNDGLGKFELAAAPLHDARMAVIVGRRDRPQFRSSEVTELGLLARIASSRMRASAGSEC